MSKPWAPNAEWKKGPRARVDSMRRGQRFLDIEGREWTYERPDGGAIPSRLALYQSDLEQVEPLDSFQLAEEAGE
jgi:hypothetical protein